MTEREEKQNILMNNKLSDTQKLRLVFDISKNSLKEYDSQLYYAILAVLDNAKSKENIYLRVIASEVMKEQENYSIDKNHMFSKGVQSLLIAIENELKKFE